MNTSAMSTVLSFVLLASTSAFGTANRELFQTSANDYMNQDPCWTSHYHCGKEDDTTYMCGRQANGATCPNSLCCSEHGWCGSTLAYCGGGCQSGPCRDDVKERYNHNCEIYIFDILVVLHCSTTHSMPTSRLWK